MCSRDTWCPHSAYILSSPELLTITWLLDHSSRKIQTDTRRLIDGLRTGGSGKAAPLPPSRLAGISSDGKRQFGPADDSGGDAVDGDTGAATDDLFVMGMLERGCIPVLQVGKPDALRQPVQLILQSMKRCGIRRPLRAVVPWGQWSGPGAALVG